MPLMFRLSYLVPFLAAAYLTSLLLGFRYFTPWDFAQVIMTGGTFASHRDLFAVYAVALTLGLFYLLAWPWSKALSRLVQWWGPSTI